MLQWLRTVSYTHLDVYKRQLFYLGALCKVSAGSWRVASNWMFSESHRRLKPYDLTIEMFLGNRWVFGVSGEFSLKMHWDLLLTRAYDNYKDL